MLKVWRNTCFDGEGPGIEQTTMYFRDIPRLQTHLISILNFMGNLDGELI